MRKLFAIFVVILFISGLMVCFLLGADDTGSIDTTLFEGTTNNIYQEDKTDINISDDDGPFEQTAISEESVNTSNADVIEEQEEEQIQSITDFNDELDLYDTWIEEKYSEFIPNDTVAEANTEDYSYKIHENGCVEIISYIGTDSMVTIPACIEECTVVYIGESAFEGCSSLQSINVAEGNKYLRSNNGVLFYEDDGILALIKYPEGKTDKEYTIPEGCLIIYPLGFKNANHLEIVNIPASLTRVDEEMDMMVEMTMFLDCSNLKNIVVY